MNPVGASSTEKPQQKRNKTEKNKKTAAATLSNPKKDETTL
jgi:hypothetical protein